MVRHVDLVRSDVSEERIASMIRVTVKNVFFWDIRNLFIPHRKHRTQPVNSM
jgi:hypothetical protein